MRKGITRVLQLISEGKNKEKTEDYQDGLNCKHTKSNYRWLDGELCRESNCKLAKSNCVIDSLNFTVTLFFLQKYTDLAQNGFTDFSQS